MPRFPKAKSKRCLNRSFNAGLDAKITRATDFSEGVKLEQTWMPGEGFKRPWPPLIKMDAAVKAKMGYVRSTARWVRGMDELHRSIALEAFLFSTVTYLFLTAAWFLLNLAGVWDAIAQTTGLHLERMPFSNCTLIICLTYIFFGIGYSIFNRRYQ